MKPYKGTVLKTSLSKDDEAKLKEAFGPSSSPAIASRRFESIGQRIVRRPSL